MEKPDFGLLGLTLALTILGLIILSSATGPLGYARFHDTFYFLKHQLLFGFIPGIAAMIVMMFIPYRFWKKMALPLLIISILLLVIVFIPGLRAEFGTARSWAKIGHWSFQPSEIVKLTFLFYLAAWFESRGEHSVRDFKTGLLPFLVIIGTVMALLLAEPDTGSMAIIVAEAFAVYFVAGSSLRHLVLLGVGSGALVAVLLKLSPYRAARFMTFLYPELDPQGIGYHVNQALLAVGSGGFWGLGLGHSRQKFQYLPEVQGDSIFAVAAEELGFVFTIGFLALFFALIMRGLKIAMKAPDYFGKFVAVGVTVWIATQAVFNIGANIGIMPLTGVPLPFVSYGGTALIATLAGIGVMLNISMHRR